MGGFNLLITITNETNKKLSTTETSKNVSVLTSTSKCTRKKYTPCSQTYKWLEMVVPPTDRWTAGRTMNVVRDEPPFLAVNLYWHFSVKIRLYLLSCLL